MADINAIARQFTDFYYSTFDSNRAGLQSLYVILISWMFYSHHSTKFYPTARHLYAVVGGLTHSRFHRHISKTSGKNSIS